MKQVKSFKLALFLLPLLLCLNTPLWAKTQPLPKVRIILNWFPEVEHGGYYAALVHGYYTDENLNVDIVGGGPDAPVVAQVATGKMDFGVANADEVVFGRAESAPVLALMAPLQTNPQCIMVHTESGIEKISDIKNTTLAMSPKPAYSHYLRMKYPFEGVKIVPYNGSVTAFIQDKKYTQQGYLFSEPFIAKSKGANARALLVAESGFNPYASALLCTEKTLKQKKDLVERLVRASIKGWQTYVESPEKTNAYIQKINPEMNAEILAYGVEAMRPLAKDSSGVVSGAMTEARWKELVSQMEETKLIKKDSVKPKECYSNISLSRSKAK